MTRHSWVLDLDGVIWLADRPIEGAAEAVARLRRRGDAVLFVTNNSASPVADVEAKLAGMGVPAKGAVVSSALAVAALVDAGETVLVCGDVGLRQAVEGRGARVVDDGDADAVVVGFHRHFDWDRMRVAATAVRRGARLLASNDDATYPTPDGPVPGAGSILAAVATASGTAPLVAGKPYQPMADLLRARLGPTGTVVGDRPDTDGRLAEVLGYRFALVLSGVTDDPTGADPEPDVVAASLADLVG